jgi:putative protein-disulfide isomerase
LRYVTQVKVNYYTDPVCPWSWALEPALRRLLQEFAGNLAVTYVMCGMVREWDDETASKLLPSTLEAQWSSGMPSDARGWLEEPPRTSHPACKAVKAAAAQGNPAPYLRRLREGFMCRRQRLDTAAALTAEARAVPGIEPQRFAHDLESGATHDAFVADLKLAKAAAERAGDDSADERPELPSLEFLDADDQVHGVYGFATYEELRNAALESGAEPTGEEELEVEEALRRYGTLTTAEIAVVCRLPGPRAPAELWRLALESRISAERVLGGELWKLA